MDEPPPIRSVHVPWDEREDDDPTFHEGAGGAAVTVLPTKASREVVKSETTPMPTMDILKDIKMAEVKEQVLGAEVQSPPADEEESPVTNSNESPQVTPLKYKDVSPAKTVDTDEESAPSDEGSAPSDEASLEDDSLVDEEQVEAQKVTTDSKEASGALEDTMEYSADEMDDDVAVDHVEETTIPVTGQEEVDLLVPMDEEKAEISADMPSDESEEENSVRLA